MELALFEFTEWFNNWLADNKLGVREAARKIGISHPMVSDLQGGARPTQGTCVKLAIAADVPTDYVLSLAGYRPKVDAQTVLVQQAEYHLASLQTDRYRKIAISLIANLVDQEEQEMSTQKKQTGPLQPVGQNPA